MTKALFFRILKEEDKQAELLVAVAKVRAGETMSASIYETVPQTFTSLPASPFVYWVNPALRNKLTIFPPFEGSGRVVRQGLATGDDFRYVRAWWEVPSARFVTRLSQEQPRPRMNPVWVPHVKAGASQPFFSPITVVVNWGDDGADLKDFRNAEGKLRSRPQNMTYYFRPGFSWTRRALRFIPYAVPSGCISTVSRYQAFLPHGDEFGALGVAGSNVVTSFLRFYGEWFTRPNYLVDNVKVLPWPDLGTRVAQGLAMFVTAQVELRRRAYQQHEPFLEFTMPTLCLPEAHRNALAFDARSLLGPALERDVAAAYGITADEQEELERDLSEAIDVRAAGRKFNTQADEEEVEEEAADEGRDFVVRNDDNSQSEALYSYAMGCAFGRWDARIARTPSLAPKLAGPFDPLPVCPPGTLVGPDGLPARRNSIASEEWLHARPDATTLPLEGSILRATVLEGEYSLSVAWDGILVDDPEHPQDIVARVRGAIDQLSGDGADALEQRVRELHDVKSLRDYFRNPRKFFAAHVER